jgi:hypothetical protein
MQKYVIFLLLILFGKTSSSQTITEKIITSLDSFSLIQPQEKAYVKTDREFYLSGETIWIKAFTTLNNNPTVLSKILYVELINGEGVLVDKKMLKLKRGSSKSAFDTRSNFLSGEYTIRAYTLWMLNFPDFIFEKRVLIKNPNDKKDESIVSNNKQDLKLDFFPEGGNLINGLKSVVAIKATNQYGNPYSLKGNILNEKNEVISNFETMIGGIAKIEITPNINETYRAQIISEGSLNKTFQFPKALAEGIVLTIDNASLNKTFASITRSKQNASHYNNLIIVAQINYELAYLGKLNLDEGLDAVAIPKKNLPPGIMQISILTQEGVPLAERIVFVANHQIDSSFIKKDIINYEKRKKNVLKINLTDFKNIDAAISITNANGFNNENQNILSYLLMSSDIKGKINQPGYYFRNKEKQTLDDLDLVMLTNGWRRYKLENVLVNQYSTPNFPFERSIRITGKVLESNGKDFLKAGKINLIINGEDSTKIVSQANTNASSVFVIDNIDFKKEATVFYQGANLVNKNAIVAVKFDPSYFDTLKKPSNWNSSVAIAANKAIKEFLNILITQKQENDKSKTLETVVIKSKKSSAIDSLNKLYSSDIFYESDQTIPVNTELSFGDIWQFLRRNIPGISIIRADTGTQVNFTRYQGADYFSENGVNGVQFFLNEIPVSVDVIESLYAEDIGLLKVYKGNSAITLGASRGAIALYTVKGKSTRDWRQKGFDFIKRLGYSVDREFSEINYSKINPDESYKDIRPTLYWNPSLKQTGNNATIEFYNDDICKKFKIVVEGIDENGKLLYAEKIIE